jgi:hypothetical protein
MAEDTVVVEKKGKAVVVLTPPEAEFKVAKDRYEMAIADAKENERLEKEAAAAQAKVDAKIVASVEYKAVQEEITRLIRECDGLQVNDPGGYALRQRRLVVLIAQREAMLLEGRAKIERKRVAKEDKDEDKE